MNQNIMDELLAVIISRYGGAIGAPAAGKAAMKLNSASVDEQIVLNGNAYEQIKNALERSGSVLELQEDEKTAAAVIMAGAAGMNPAIVVIRAEGNTVWIKATAKEGLIKQHTAEKAIKKLKEALSDYEEK